jgi:LuxR family maltose regulon positive regulatory protein
VDRLDRQRRPLTLVSAAAGFGKSTLLSDWLSDRPGTAWLALDERDRDPVRFWTHVVAALRTVAPNLGGQTEDALRDGAGDVESAVTLLLNDLQAVEHDVTLVLDDYHAVDSPELVTSMGLFLANLPEHVGLVIATRADPGLPLASLRARGDLLEVRAADLRFTAEEATDYLNGAMGLSLSPGDITALEDRTEGWIAALQLAALSLDGRADTTEFIKGFAGDDRFVLDYLAGEVLERQDDDTRAFLLQTSILRRLEGSLCDAVTGRSGGKAMLEHLDRSNLFLVPLDDRRSSYRYHHLFGDVLHAWLLDELPDQVPELHQRASSWCADRGDLDEAIRHAFAAPDDPRAAELIELAIPALRQNRREATMRAWFDALPRKLFDDRPVLAIGYVGALMASGAFDEVETLLASIDRALEPAHSDRLVVVDQQGFADLPAQLSIQRAGMSLIAGDPAAAVVHAERALELADHDHHLQRGAASALVALARWATGDLISAEPLYVEAISRLTKAGYLADALGCSLALADIQIAQGRLGDAERTFDSGFRLTVDHPGLRGAADMHVGMSEVLIERNDLDAAEEHLATSAALGEAGGLPQHAYRWRVTSARLRRARGDLQGALELINEAEPLFDTDFSPPVRPVAAIRARVQLANGDLQAATAWADDRGLSVEDDLSYVHEYEHVTLARILIARDTEEPDTGQSRSAIALLDRLLAAADAGARRGSAIEIQILRATALLAVDDEPAAVVALQDALGRAEPDCHVRLFLHSGQAVTTLLRSMASQADPPPHLETVLAAAAGAPEPAAPPGGSDGPALVDELSPRELDVLRLLRSELTGPEIATELVVSLNTVRTHTKNVFMKLGVNSRRAAVRRADELGL